MTEVCLVRDWWERSLSRLRQQWVEDGSSGCLKWVESGQLTGGKAAETLPR